MNTFIKIFGIIVLAIIIGFSMTSCNGLGVGNGSGGGNGSDGGLVALGEKLVLSGQVSTANWNGKFSYTNFTGNFSIEDYIGGSGKVKNGILDYSIETPDYLDSINDIAMNIVDFFSIEFKSFSANPPSAQGKAILYLYASDGVLFRESYSGSYSGKSFSENYDSVIYVYVDRDVAITGKGTTVTASYQGQGGTVYEDTYTTKNFNLTLKKGWNAMRVRTESNGTGTGAIDNPTCITTTSNVTITSDNPSLRWVYYNFNNGYSANISTFEPSLLGNLQNENINNKGGLKTFSRIFDKK